METKKVFLSAPMNRKTDEQIAHELLMLKHYANARWPKDELEFVDNWSNKEKETNDEPQFVFLRTIEEQEKYNKKERSKAIRYLAEALAKLADCDAALFYPGWERARGCLVEHETCERYRIPIYHVE